MLHTPIVSTFIQYQSSRAVSHRPCTRVATVHVVVLSALRKGQLHIVNTMLAAATKTLLAPSSFAARSMRASYARPVQQRQTVAGETSAHRLYDLSRSCTSVSSRRRHNLTYL